MRVWAELFRELPLEPVDLRMPDGAFWLWVDDATGALTAATCPGAIEVPFVSGSEPTGASECMAALDEENDESFWSRWIDRD
jgi:penicillin-binding protein 1B